MSKVILRKYGESTTIPFSLFEIDGVDFKVDAVWTLGDVKLMKNEGAEANITVGFIDEGQGYSQALTAANMQFARGKLYIVDQGTKAWLDTGITIETYGHASAQHPNMGNGSESRLAELDQANLPQDIADVADLVAAAAPVPYTPDASSVIITGTETSGTYASTATDDSNRWIITDVGAGIEVIAECNLGVGRLATSLRINGFLDAGANRIVEVYIYNYTTASYDKLSAGTAATEMRKNTSDKDYEFALTSANTDPSTSIGEVKIKFLSAQSNNGDTLNLDFVVTTGEASGTSSAAAVADAIANSNWGESVNHIPRFTGELFYIAGATGDDGNSGKYPDSGLATISATVAKASAGDYLKVFAASFAEAVDLNKNGLELHGEIGATITGNGGVPLTISANDCKIDEIILTPAAGQIGLVITGNYNKISILRINGGLISVQDTGIGNKITLVEADEYTGTGFDLQGTGARLLKCFAISSQASTRGYHLSNTAADRTIIEESTSVNNDTAGFEVVAGVTNALIADCVESATCGARVDSGIDTAWRNHSATDHQLLQAKEATLVAGVEFSASGIAALFNHIVDNTYNIAKSFGKRIRGIEEYQGYAGGKIYINTTGGGEAGSDPYVNGVLDKPVSNLADALLLSASLGINCFEVSSGSSLIFISGQDGKCYIGNTWTLALGSQNINGTFIKGAVTSGISAALVTAPKFDDCTFNATTLPPGHYHSCGFANGIMAAVAGDYFFTDCESDIAGGGFPSFDFGVAIGTVNANFREYRGELELKNMGQSGTDKASIDGNGRVSINANCIGGIISIQGHQDVIGAAAFIAAGGIISDASRFATDQLITHIIGADSDTLESLSDQIDSISAGIIVVGAGGSVTPSYAEEGEPEDIVQGDVINKPRYVTGDQSAKTIFFGAKTASGDASYAVGLIQCTVGAYNSEDDQTSYLIPFAANDTKTVTPATYKGESEVRDANGTSNPVTADRFDLNVIGEIIP